MKYGIFTLLFFATSLFAQKPAVPVRNNAHPFWDNIVRAYINFEGTGTTTEDFSKFDITGTFDFGTDGSNPTWVADGDGSGVYTVAFSDRNTIDLGNVQPDIVNGFTMMVRFNGYSTPQGQQIVGNTVATGTTNTFRFYWQGSVDRVAACVTISSSETCETHTNVLTADSTVWYTYTMTFDNDSVAVYHNGGEREVTNTANSRVDTTDGYTLKQGAKVNAGASFDGEISFVYLWSVVLSDSLISAYTSDPYQGFGINRKQRAIVW